MKHVLFLLFITFSTSIILNAQTNNLQSVSINGDMPEVTSHHAGDFQLSESDVYSAEQFDIDPGIAPEGDYMANSCFTPDGLKVILANKISNVITVYDWNSMEVLANITLGEYPSCVKANNDHAIVGCQFSDSVYFIDLIDYSIEAILPTAEQPCWIELSPDGNIAYVACDIDNVCMAFDMTNHSYIDQISDFPIYLNTFAWAAQVNRGWEKYNGFKVLPDGERIAISGTEDNIAFYSTSSFDLLENVSITSPRAVAISGDGNFLACAASIDNVCHVYKINLANYAVEADVEISGYDLGTNAIVVNMDGSKAYIGTNNNSSTLVRFETQDFVNFTSTYTAFWLGVSHDHQYAVSGQNRFSIINFDTEAIEDQHIGLNQSFGVVSPVANHVFAYDPLRYEGAYFFDFSSPGDIDYRGSKLSGLAPEGDTPGAVAINNDRTKAIAAGNLSYNVPVIDLGSMSALTAVDVEESCYDVKITPDGLWGIAGGYNNNNIKIIDMTTNTLVKTIFTGQRPMIVEIAPDGQHAYIGNIKQNTVSVVELDGANSSVITSVSCGVIGVYMPFFGIRSAVRVSPDGAYVLITASFDDELKILDTETNQIVATLPTGDFPLDVAIDDESKTALVVNTFDASYDIISLDGANSSISYHKSLNADYPMDVAYNDIEGLFYVLSANSEKVFKIDPASGEVVESYNPGGPPFHIEFYSGIPITQIQGNDNSDHKIVYGSTEYVIPFAAAPFSFNTNAGMVGVPIPGPDLVSIIDLGPPPYINEPAGLSSLYCYPNPASDKLYISADIDADQVEIMDLSGRILFRTDQISSSGLDVSTLKPGQYIIRISSKSYMLSKKLIIE